MLKLQWTFPGIAMKVNLWSSTVPYNMLNSRAVEQETSLHLKIPAGQHSQSLCSIWWMSNRKEIHLTCTGLQSHISALHAKSILTS